MRFLARWTSLALAAMLTHPQAGPASTGLNTAGMPGEMVPNTPPALSMEPMLASADPDLHPGRGRSGVHRVRIPQGRFW
jgi:hypothetical protein